MPESIKYGICFLFVVSFASGAEPSADHTDLDPSAKTYLEKRIAEFDQIPDDRKARLNEIATYIQSHKKSGQPIRLTFICTHNSRRSHLSQIWAAAAANYYGVRSIETFSGGTEATAFNPRAIATIMRAGLKVEKIEDGKNPRYAIRLHETKQPLVCFSKVYNDEPNPKEDFCAIMTCSQADKNCPVVKGSSARVAIPFEDPKVSDDKPDEAATYDERCAQICREMLYVFSQVRP